MVVLGILGLFENLFSAIIGLLPNPGLPGLNTWATSIVGASWFSHLAWANNYFPLDVVLGAAVVVWGVWVVMWVFRLTIAILVKLHVLGGSDD